MPVFQSLPSICPHETRAGTAVMCVGPVDVRDFCRALVEELAPGYRFIDGPCTPGRTALLGGEWDACVLDGTGNAEQALEIIAASAQRGCDRPIFLLTDADDRILGLEAIHAGAADCLVRGILTAPALERALLSALARKRTEAALDESRERFRRLVDGLDAIVWEADACTFEFRFVSHRAEEILGYPVERWLGDRGFWDMLIHPDDRERALAGYETVRSTGRRHEFEHRAVAASGAAVWLHNKVDLLRDDSGRPSRLRGVMVDVTDRKLAEDALRQRERQLQAIFDNALDALVIADDKMRFRDANPAACSLLGVARAELLRGSVAEFVSGGTDADLTPAWHAFLAKGTGRGEYQIHRPDGERRAVEYCATANFLPGRHLFVFRDVSERQNAENAARQSEARFRSLIEHSSDLISILDEKGIARYESPSVRGMSGYEPEELVGTSPFELIHPEDRAVALEAFRRVGAGEPVESLSYRLLHKDGSWRVLESVAVNLLDDPVVGGIVVNSRDVTDRVRAEEDFRRAITGARCLVWHATVYDHPTFLHWEIRVSNAEAAAAFLPLTIPEGLDYSRAFYLNTLEEDRPQMNATSSEAIRGGRSGYHQEYRIRTATDEVRWLYEDVRIQREVRGRWQLVGVCTDITELKLAEAERNQSELRFGTLIEQIPAVTYIIAATTEGETLYVSPQIEKLLGITPQEWMSDTGAWLTHLHPEDRGRVLRERNGRRGAESYFESQYRLVGTDGRVVWIHDRSVLLRDAQGRPTCVQGVWLDLTERRRAEKALNESEARYRRMLQTASEAIGILGVDERFEYVNTQFTTLIGCPVEAVLGRSIYDFIYGEDHAELRARLAARRQGEGGHYEIRILRPDGTMRWVLISASSILDEAGEYRGALGMITDLTERKAVEERQQALTTGLQTVLEMADELIGCEDLDTLLRRAVELARERLALERCSIWLQEGERLRGTFGTNVQGVTTDERTHTTPVDGKWCDVLRPLSEGGMRSLILVEPRINVDEEVTALPPGWVALTPIRSATGTFGVFCNDAGITDAPVDETKQEVVVVFSSLLGGLIERVRAQMALRDSEALFRTIFRSAPIGMARVSLDGRIENANQALEQMLGYSRGELSALPILHTTHPDDLEVDREVAQAVLRGDREGYHVEKRYVRKDGESVWARLSVSMVRDASGEPSFLLAMIEDVTDWKQLEEQLRQSQKMDAIGRLAGGVAHDFNNMLAVITGYSELLLEQVGAGDPVHAGLHEIRQAGERAAALTRQLLAFSRKQVLAPKVLDLNDTISNLGKMLRRLLGEDILLTTSFDPQLVRVKADPGQIEQVIMNLAVNARDAMPEGGSITIETRTATWDATAARKHGGMAPGRHAMIAVHDTGYGMDGATRQRIFEPFFTTKEPGRGTGLGLATVYGIIQQSGGHIEVESEPQDGSVFRLYLPEADGELPEESPAAALAALPRGSEVVLLVEDEPMVRELVRTVLNATGYQVLEARTPEDAVEVCRSHPGRIDLLLTDVVMPRLGGRELAERLTPQRPEMRVIFMSGYTDDAVVRQGVSSDEVPFLEKPFTPLVLATKVREVLGRTQ